MFYNPLEEFELYSLFLLRIGNVFFSLTQSPILLFGLGCLLISVQLARRGKHDWRKFSLQRKPNRYIPNHFLWVKYYHYLYSPWYNTISFNSFIVYLSICLREDTKVDTTPLVIGCIGIAGILVLSRFLTIPFDKYYVTCYSRDDNMTPDVILLGLKFTMNTWYSKIVDYAIISKGDYGFMIYMRVRSYLNFLTIFDSFNPWSYVNEHQALHMMVSQIETKKLMLVMSGLKDPQQILISSDKLRQKIIYKFLMTKRF